MYILYTNTQSIMGTIRDATVIECRENKLKPKYISQVLSPTFKILR
jgi:hypothetical protein